MNFASTETGNDGVWILEQGAAKVNISNLDNSANLGLPKRCIPASQTEDETFRRVHSLL